MNFVSVVKRCETHRGIEKSDKLILNLTRLNISIVFQFSYSQMACTKTFTSFCKQNVYSLVVQFSKIKHIQSPSLICFSNFYIISFPNQLCKPFFQISFEAYFYWLAAPYKLCFLGRN